MIEKCFLHQDIKMCVIYIERVKEGRNRMHSNFLISVKEDAF